jgi:hypothetical protein
MLQLDERQVAARGLALLVPAAASRSTSSSSTTTACAWVCTLTITSRATYLHCDDLAEAIERAQRAGAQLLSPRGPRDWGDEAACVADPEGNVVALARPLWRFGHGRRAASIRAM